MSGKPTVDAPPAWRNLLRFENTTAYRYWRLELSDPSAEVDYIEIGRLFIGQAFQPAVNVDINPGLGLLPPDFQGRTAFGRMVTDRRGDPAHRLVLPFAAPRNKWGPAFAASLLAFLALNALVFWALSVSGAG